MEAFEQIRQAVKSRRVKLGMTQSRLASEAGIEQPTISRFESGKSISAETVTRILRVLGLRIIVEDDGRPL